jgi:hypothetical protein
MVGAWTPQSVHCIGENEEPAQVCMVDTHWLIVLPNGPTISILQLTWFLECRTHHQTVQATLIRSLCSVRSGRNYPGKRTGREGRMSGCLTAQTHPQQRNGPGSVGFILQGVTPDHRMGCWLQREPADWAARDRPGVMISPTTSIDCQILHRGHRPRIAPSPDLSLLLSRPANSAITSDRSRLPRSRIIPPLDPFTHHHPVAPATTPTTSPTIHSHLSHLPCRSHHPSLVSTTHHHHPRCHCPRKAVFGCVLR